MDLNGAIIFYIFFKIVLFFAYIFYLSRYTITRRAHFK